MTLNSEQAAHYRELMRLRDEVCSAFHYHQVAMRSNDINECSCELMRARFRLDEKLKQILSLIPTKELTP